MKTSIGLGLVFAAIATLLCGVSESADAAKQKAKEHFKKGTALFEKGDFDSAAKEFEAAYELSPHPQVLYNIASCQDQGGRHVEAVATYRRYLAETDVDPSELVAIRARLAELEAMVSELRIGCAVSNCDIRVDGQERGRAPVSVVLSPGEHSVEASVDGRIAEVAQVQLVAGEDQSLTLALGGAPPPPVAAPQTPDVESLAQAPRSESKLHWPFWVASGTTLAAGAALVVFALKTNKEEQEFIESGRTDEGLHEDGVRDKLITNVLIGVTGVAAATSVALLIHDLRGGGETEQGATIARLRILPAAGIGCLATVEF